MLWQQAVLTSRAPPQHRPRQIDLRQLYDGVPPGAAARYRLRAMACYHLRHYSACVRLAELGGRWVAFDDASASAVGAWPEVRRRCEAGRMQPSVLFYEAEELCGAPARRSQPGAGSIPGHPAAKQVQRERHIVLRTRQTRPGRQEHASNM